MSKINFLPPWVETGLQPAFYDRESGTVLQQTSRMYDKVNQLVRSVNQQNDTIAEFIEDFNDLRDYVDDYFENLDVQAEIDHKLDEMVEDGTIKSILNNELLGEINERVLQNTLDIDANTEALDGKVSQGEASSITMEMLTQDVREAMTGGSTAVVAENSVDMVNIVNGAVTIEKLDDYLKDTKVIVYGAYKNLGEKSSGIIIEVPETHKAQVSGAGSTTYGWYKVALTRGKFYTFTGYNNYSATGIIVVDSEENVVAKATNPGGALNMTSLFFRANLTGMYAYINVTNSQQNTTNLWNCYNTSTLREVVSIENKVKELEPVLIKTVSGHYPSYTHDTNDMPAVATYANTDFYIYAMNKGVKYHIISQNWSQVVGLYILSLTNAVIYQSSDSSVGDNHVPVDYTFTASQDGFIVVPKILGAEPTVEVVNPYGSSNGSGESLTFNKWFALGDSLTEVNFRASENYVGYITEELDITSVNLGHSGSGYKKANSGTTLTTEISSITSYDYDTDIITVMGSINDFEYLENDLGELGDTTTDTIYGAMYVFFNTLQTQYMGTRLGVITPPVIGVSYDTQKPKFEAYNKALKETAELFGVPVLDLTYSCNLKPWESTFRNTFYSADGTGSSGQVDSTHPNSKGHWLIHNKIKEFLKTL